MKLLDATGQTFGRLLVVCEKPGVRKHRMVECVCSCGKTTVARLSHMRAGRTKSCGCLSVEMAALRNRTHGACTTTEYKSWEKMKARCRDPRNNEYHRYGARGIAVCDRWLGPLGFSNFLADMGKKPTHEHSIDRIDNTRGYCPNNCRWADRLTQANNKRNNRRIIFNGMDRTVSEWERALGFPRGVVLMRLYKGMTNDRALSQPLRITKRHRK
jgi:hypothetical protein